MVRYCLVNSCGSRNESDIHLFKFSPRFIHQDMWIKFIENEGFLFSRNKNFYVCEFHFEDHMILRYESRCVLSADAFPSKVNANI